MFTLHIDTRNAAFRDEDGLLDTYELADVVGGAADRLRDTALYEAPILIGETVVGRWSTDSVLGQDISPRLIGKQVCFTSANGIEVVGELRQINAIGDGGDEIFVSVAGSIRSLERLHTEDGSDEWLSEHRVLATATVILL